MSGITAMSIAAHTVHDKPPAGFSYADAIQEALFADTGSVPGAAKVAIVKGSHYDPTDEYPHVHLATRLKPPRTFEDIQHTVYAQKRDVSLAEYIQQYNAGWKAGNRSSDSVAWGSGLTPHAWDDGYLDAAAGRMKWHLAYCSDHDNCGVG